MTLSITGMSSLLALKLLDSTESTEKTLIRSTPSTAKAIEKFKDAASSITSAKDFVSNYDVYSFVMQAFDLKDQMFGKAMVQKILESDSSQSGALVNQMTDPRFTELYKSLGFTDGGTANTTFSNSDWQDQIVQRFVDQSYINDEADQNATVGAALEFRQKAPEVSSWYDILKDADMGKFMRTVLNIPDGVVNQDLDSQVALFEKKYDITKLQDPAEVEKLVQKYVIISDAQDSSTTLANNAAVTLMTGVVNGSSGSYVPATLDITSIDMSAFSASRIYG
ncbi:DUF1217 domain-containing protein [Acidimangrovimonas sediminis]|uniref:DUF1217 domain-containing protein n=1 Tax=Acidimangrovimonas sediminis TaxID=2056283 RepID=UPI000C7F7BB5|nr:DUF1217 domain-containing protein [Acidimangrovimonas sediminis]